MRRFFFQSVITAFTIVGSIIGAGFITGKEIYEFFATDFSVSGIYTTFLLFTVLIFFTMQNRLSQTSEKILSTFVGVANVLIGGCMISALNEVYKSIFNKTENFEIFTVISAILIFIISCKGIGATEKLNAVLIPLIIVVILIFGILKRNDVAVSISPKTYVGAVKPIIYVGFNIILSFKLIKNSGEKLTPPFKILSAIITAVIVCGLICVISFAVIKSENNDSMPFKSLFVEDKKLRIIIDIISVFAIFTTLASAFYTSVNSVLIKDSVRLKIIVFLIAYAISKIGFAPIVEKIYPTLGVLSYLIIFITFLLSRTSQAERRARTFRPLKGKV